LSVLHINSLDNVLVFSISSLVIFGIFLIKLIKYPFSLVVHVDPFKVGIPVPRFLSNFLARGSLILNKSLSE
jgi:hypothetical protein